MKRLQEAMQIEQQLRNDNRYNVRDFAPYAKNLGYQTVKEYIEERNSYNFKNWIPKVNRPSMKNIQEFCLDAIKNKKDQIIIPYGTGLHAWHGNTEIDYELCKELGVQVIDLDYEGGIIVGSEKDLSIMIIMPNKIKIEQETFLNKIVTILSKYLNNVTWMGNDILTDAGKICGITYRNLKDITVFTAQFSFDDYSEYIEKICTKKSNKKPAFIDSALLTKEELEKEFLNWIINKQ